MPLRTTTKDLLNVEERFNRTRKKPHPADAKTAGSFRFPNGEMFHPRGAAKYDRRRPAKIGYEMRNSVSMSTLPTIATSFDSYPDAAIPVSAPSSATSRDDVTGFAPKYRSSRFSLLSPSGNRSALPSMLSRLGLTPSLALSQTGSPYIDDLSGGPHSIRGSTDTFHLKSSSLRPPLPSKHINSSPLVHGLKPRSYTASKLLARLDLTRQLRSKNTSDIPTIINVDELQRDSSELLKYPGSIVDRGEFNSSAVSLRNHTFRSNNLLRATSSDESPTSNLTVNLMENDDSKRPDVGASDSRQDSFSLFYSSSMEIHNLGSDVVKSGSGFPNKAVIGPQNTESPAAVLSRTCTNETEPPSAALSKSVLAPTDPSANDDKNTFVVCEAQDSHDSTFHISSTDCRLPPPLDKLTNISNRYGRLADNVGSSQNRAQSLQQSPYMAGELSASDSAIDRVSANGLNPLRPLSIRGVPLTPVLFTDTPLSPTCSAVFSMPHGPPSSADSTFYSPHANSSLVTLMQEDQPDVPVRRDLIEIESDALRADIGSPRLFDAKEPPARSFSNGSHSVKRCSSLYSSRGWSASESNLQRSSSYKLMDAVNADPSVPKRSVMRPLSLFRSASESGFGNFANSSMLPVGSAGSMSASSSVYLDVPSQEDGTNLNSALNTPVKAPHINLPSHIPLVSSPRLLVETPKRTGSLKTITNKSNTDSIVKTPLATPQSQAKHIPAAPKPPPKLAKANSPIKSTSNMTKSKSFNLKALCKRIFGKSSHDDLQASSRPTKSKGAFSKAGAARMQSFKSLDAAGRNGLRSSAQQESGIQSLSSPSASFQAQANSSTLSPIEMRLPELVQSEQDLLHDVMITMDHYDETIIPPITREVTVLPFLRDDELTSAQIQDQKIKDETRDDGTSENTSIDCVASISSLHNEYIDDNIRFLRNEFGWYRLGEKELAQELNESAKATTINVPEIAIVPSSTDSGQLVAAAMPNGHQQPAQLYPEYLKYARQLRDLPSLQVTVDKFKEISDGDVFERRSPSTKPTILRTKQLSGKTSRLVGFSAQIRICETFSADAYKRYNKAVTQYTLTDEKDISMIKLELNRFKSNEMLVHEKSQQNTHFFY